MDYYGLSSRLFHVNIFIAFSQILNFKFVSISVLHQPFSIGSQRHGMFAKCIIICLCFKLAFLWLASPQPFSSISHPVLEVIARQVASSAHWNSAVCVKYINENSCIILMTHIITGHGSSPQLSIRMYFWLFISSISTLV